MIEQGIDSKKNDSQLNEMQNTKWKIISNTFLLIIVFYLKHAVFKLYRWEFLFLNFQISRYFSLKDYYNRICEKGNKNTNIEKYIL